MVVLRRAYVAIQGGRVINVILVITTYLTNVEIRYISTAHISHLSHFDLLSPLPLPYL